MIRKLHQTFIIKGFYDFLNLIYPKNCVCCNVSLAKQEKVFCTNCLYELPRTNFHQLKVNPVEQCFWGRVEIEKATAYFFFKKGSKYQKILHKLKYKNQPEIGIVMGKNFGAELLRDNAFNNVDYIVPIPLHIKKLKKRTYNQSETIANGMAQFLNAKVNTKIVERITFTETQTNKTRIDRWENVNNVFKCMNPNLIENKHVLLIDDVITTGATIEACANALKKATKNVKISVATLAFASN